MNNQTDTQDTFTVYTAGPDDVDHFDDELSALRYANAINRTYVADRLKHPEDDVLCVATVANGRAGTSPSLSDEDIADIKFALRSSLVIDNDMSTEDFKQIARAIEAKCRSLRAGQSEPVAPYCWQECAEDGTPFFDEGTFASTPSAFDYSRPLYIGGAGQSPTVPTAAERDVLAERKRQVSVEGWTPEHDDEHDNGELARAAAAYAYPELVALENVCVWPWGPDWWKPKDARSNLVKACALGLAEIERLDRAALRSTLPQTTGDRS